MPLTTTPSESDPTGTVLATIALKSELAHRTNANHSPLKPDPEQRHSISSTRQLDWQLFCEYTKTKVVNPDTHCEILVIHLEV